MLGSIKWIIGNWQMLLLILALTSFTVLGVYLKGRADGIAHAEKKELVETVGKIQERQTIELSIMRKPKVEVQKELEKKWCRDCQ
jgi:hypothetical protein